MFLLHLALNPGPSKIVNWEPGLGWVRTRPLAVPNSTEAQLGLRVPTPQWVLGPPSGVCLALGPVFPEVAHRGPSLNWSRGAYPH